GAVQRDEREPVVLVWTGNRASGIVEVHVGDAERIAEAVVAGVAVELDGQPVVSGSGEVGAVRIAGAGEVEEEISRGAAGHFDVHAVVAGSREGAEIRER